MLAAFPIGRPRNIVSALLAVPLFLVSAALQAQGARDEDRLLEQAREGVFSIGTAAETISHRVVEAARASGNHVLHARALRIHARALLEKGRFAAARTEIEESLNIAHRHLDDRAIGAAHIVFAFWFARRGELGRAKQHAGEARRLLGERATHRQAAELKLLAGLAEIAHGSHPQGVPHMYETLEAAQRYGFDDVAAQVHLVMSKVAERQGSLDSGYEHANAANSLIAANGFTLLEPAGAFATAMLAHRREAPVAERRMLLERCIALAEATGHPVWAAEAERFRGCIACWLDADPEAALVCYLRGIEKARAADDLDCLGYLVALAAQMHHRCGRPEQALAVLDAYAEPLSLCWDTRLRVHVSRTRAKAYGDLGRFEPAFRSAWEAADTVRWLVRHESTGALLRHKYELRSERARQTTLFWAVVATLAVGATILLWRLHSLQRRTNLEQVRLNADLETALSQVRELRGMLPICASCKSIRDDEGYWHRIESYLLDHSKASLSHGICPKCASDLYPDLYPDIEKPRQRAEDSDAC